MQKKKQREVLFTIQSQDMVNNLLTPENKKLVCKYKFSLFM